LRRAAAAKEDEDAEEERGITCAAATVLLLVLVLLLLVGKRGRGPVGARARGGILAAPLAAAGLEELWGMVVEEAEVSVGRAGARWSRKVVEPTAME
jgi:hypothetical protein